LAKRLNMLGKLLKNLFIIKNLIMFNIFITDFIFLQILFKPLGRTYPLKGYD
jgi:hypothetical protein